MHSSHSDCSFSPESRDSWERRLLRDCWSGSEPHRIPTKKRTDSRWVYLDFKPLNLSTYLNHLIPSLSSLHASCSRFLLSSDSPFVLPCSLDLILSLTTRCRFSLSSLVVDFSLKTQFYESNILHKSCIFSYFHRATEVAPLRIHNTSFLQYDSPSEMVTLLIPFRCFPIPP